MINFDWLPKFRIVPKIKKGSEKFEYFEGFNIWEGSDILKCSKKFGRFRNSGMVPKI